MIRGEGTAIVRGVTPDDVFRFVLDPAQYTKADTKVVWVTKLADTADGMVAREDGKFLGLFPGSVITRYRWEPPYRIDVTLERGVPRSIHAWFEIDPVDGGTRIHHVEEIDMGWGPVDIVRYRADGGDQHAIVHRAKNRTFVLRPWNAMDDLDAYALDAPYEERREQRSFHRPGLPSPRARRPK